MPGRLNGLGNVMRLLGDSGQAAKLLQEAVGVGASMGMTLFAGQAIMSVGVLAVALRELERGVELLVAADRLEIVRVSLNADDAREWERPWRLPADRWARSVSR